MESVGVRNETATVEPPAIDLRAPLARNVGRAIDDAIAFYLYDNPDFQVFNPDNVKMLSRSVRDALLARFDIRQRAHTETT